MLLTSPHSEGFRGAETAQDVMGAGAHRTAARTPLLSAGSGARAAGLVDSGGAAVRRRGPRGAAGPGSRGVPLVGRPGPAWGEEASSGPTAGSATTGWLNVPQTMFLMCFFTASNTIVSEW